MDQNSNHFPTLLAVCILVSVFLYIVSNIVNVIHQRKLSKKSTLGKNVIVQSSTNFDDEEQQLANQLKESENN